MRKEELRKRPGNAEGISEDPGRGSSDPSPLPHTWGCQSPGASAMQQVQEVGAGSKLLSVGCGVAQTRQYHKGPEGGALDPTHVPLPALPWPPTLGPVTGLRKGPAEGTLSTLCSSSLMVASLASNVQPERATALACYGPHPLMVKCGSHGSHYSWKPEPHHFQVQAQHTFTGVLLSGVLHSGSGECNPDVQGKF